MINIDKKTVMIAVGAGVVGFGAGYCVKTVIDNRKNAEKNDSNGKDGTVENANGADRNSSSDASRVSGEHSVEAPRVADGEKKGLFSKMKAKFSRKNGKNGKAAKNDITKRTPEEMDKLVEGAIGTYDEHGNYIPITSNNTCITQSKDKTIGDSSVVVEAKSSDGNDNGNDNGNGASETCSDGSDDGESDRNVTATNDIGENHRIPHIHFISNDSFFEENVVNKNGRLIRFKKNMIHYYAGDDTFADDDDKMIYDTESFIGTEVADAFKASIDAGRGTSLWTELYVRNENSCEDFSILLHMSSYAEEVLGISREDEEVFYNEDTQQHGEADLSDDEDDDGYFVSNGVKYFDPHKGENEVEDDVDRLDREFNKPIFEGNEEFDEPDDDGEEDEEGADYDGDDILEKDAVEPRFWVNEDEI